MKKIFLTFLFLFSSFAFVEGKGIITSIVVDGVEMTTYENDFVKLNFELVYSDLFLRVEIENKTNDRISIEWENSRLDNNKVVFSDDTRLTMRNEKADEVVIAHSKTHKDITGSNHILSSKVSKITTKSKIKKQENTSVLILPIRQGDKVLDIVINLKFSLE